VEIMAIVLTVVGTLWLAWRTLDMLSMVWGVLVVLIPIPLVGIFVWFRTGWDSSLRVPMALYLAGYALTAIFRFQE